MNMDIKRAEAAVEYKHNGYNCAQSVVLAYADILGLDREQLINLSSGFGAGMGGMEGTCGALCGAVIAAGILNNGNKTPILSKQIVNVFKEKCGATICREIKGLDTGKILCSCDDCVKNAVLSLTTVFENQQGVNI